MIPVIILSVFLIWSISIRNPMFQLRYGEQLMRYALKAHERLSDVVRRMKNEMSPEEFKKIKEEYAKKNIDLADFL